MVCTRRPPLCVPPLHSCRRTTVELHVTHMSHAPCVTNSLRSNRSIMRYRCCRRWQTSPPVLPSGELAETYTLSLILAYSLHDMITWCHPQNRRYIMYHIADRGGPSQGNMYRTFDEIRTRCIWGWFGLGGWLHTEVVWLPKDGHPALIPTYCWCGCWGLNTWPLSHKFDVYESCTECIASYVELFSCVSWASCTCGIISWCWVHKRYEQFQLHFGRAWLGLFEPVTSI